MAVAVTFPGKIGDAILQFPCVYHFHRVHGEKVTAIFDPSLRPLETLFRAQPSIEGIEYMDGVTSYVCGGQPYDFGKDAELRARFEYVFHMGFRSFPHLEITAYALRQIPVPVSWVDLVEMQPFAVAEKDPRNRLVIHGTLLTHQGRTPYMWTVLHHAREFIKGEFDEVVFVGSQKERDYAKSLYPEWDTFDDQNDFLTLAQYLKDSRLVLGGGSCVVALAGGVHTPSVRIHDHVVGTEIVVPWTNVAPRQMNVVPNEHYNHLIVSEFCKQVLNQHERVA